MFKTLTVSTVFFVESIIFSEFFAISLDLSITFTSFATAFVISSDTSVAFSRFLEVFAISVELSTTFIYITKAFVKPQEYPKPSFIITNLVF